MVENDLEPLKLFVTQIAGDQQGARIFGGGRPTGDDDGTR
jgi:hypothetical protein